jgi:hypothetical protein
MTAKGRAGSIFGTISLLALLINWGSVVYFSTPCAYEAARLWGPLAEHRTVKFALIMLLGAVSGIIAGARHAKGWFVLAALNVISYLLEFMVS